MSGAAVGGREVDNGIAHVGRAVSKSWGSLLVIGVLVTLVSSGFLRINQQTFSIALDAGPWFRAVLLTLGIALILISLLFLAMERFGAPAGPKTIYSAFSILTVFMGTVLVWYMVFISPRGDMVDWFGFNITTRQAWVKIKPENMREYHGKVLVLVFSREDGEILGWTQSKSWTNDGNDRLTAECSEEAMSNMPLGRPVNLKLYVTGEPLEPTLDRTKINVDKLHEIKVCQKSIGIGSASVHELMFGLRQLSHAEQQEVMDQLGAILHPRN